MLQESEIFDRRLLHERRRRLVQRLAASALPDFLLVHAVDDVADRLGLIKRQFSRALCIGSYHGVMADRLRARGIAQVVEAEAVDGLLSLGSRSDADDLIVADEEALPFEAQSFDLALAVLSLQYVNDLPGVLVQIQRLLKPDGLFIGVVLGGATLGELRQAMLAAEAEVTGGASPRVMPFVDVRDAGGLLQRAKFALPVADAETLTVTYASALELMRELKFMGASNVLHERSRVPVTRGLLLRAAEIYAERFPATDGDGRIAATFELVTLTGWSPDPSQQQPLKPGTAQMSLSEALKPPEN
jgi:NADH dehydrogenase [ubiquinone] 1 alpha subcomplex assembly factor 5